MKRTIIIIIAILSQVYCVWGQCINCDSSTAIFGSSVIGSNNSVEGQGSIAIGIDSHVGQNGLNTIAIGGMIESNGPFSFVIGTGGDPIDGSRLINTYPESLMIGFNSTKPTLFISTSQTNFGYNKTGQIGIGNVTEPQAKLHIRSDDAEPAILFIEPNNWEAGESASLQLGNTNHSIISNKSNGIYFNSENNFIFSGNNSGFGVEEPKAKVHINGDLLFESNLNGIIMKSEDGNCWKGTISNNGELFFSQIDCETLSSTENVTEPKYSEVFIYPNPTNGQITVEYIGNKRNLRLMVKTINGTLVATYKINKGENEIELKNISDQMIVVSVFTNKGELISTNKVVIKN